jgi:importin subunit beta-1
LIKGLNNHKEYQVCGIAVDCVGDLMRGVGADLPKEAVDEIAGSLLRCLAADNLDRTVKPHILATFGDIAMALNGNFEPYMEDVMQMLHGVSQTPLDVEDAEVCEYVNEVRPYHMSHITICPFQLLSNQSIHTTVYADRLHIVVTPHRAVFFY